MLKLMKYELIRKWRAILVFLSIVLVINANVLYRVAGKWQNTNLEQMAALGFFFGGLLTVFFILFIIDVTNMYSRDLNNKTGYMVFLTPNSGYKILGSKILTGLLEGLLFLVVFLILLAVSFLGFYSQPLTEMMNSEVFTSVISEFDMSIGELLPFLFSNLITMFTSIVVLILTIFAAISIRKSILAEVRFAGLLSLIIFMLLVWLNGKITSLVVTTINKAELFTHGIHYFNVISVLQIIIGVALFVLSAYLLDKKMDV